MCRLQKWMDRVSPSARLATARSLGPDGFGLNYVLCPISIPQCCPATAISSSRASCGQKLNPVGSKLLGLECYNTCDWEFSLTQSYVCNGLKGISKNSPNLWNLKIMSRMPYDNRDWKFPLLLQSYVCYGTKGINKNRYNLVEYPSPWPPIGGSLQDVYPFICYHSLLVV